MNRASFTFWLKVVWPWKNYFSKTTLLLSLSCENDVASQLVVFSCFVRSAYPEQSNMASGRRSRSRSSAPHTPSTPTDAGQVSDHDDMPIMRFDCNVIMSSGESLKSFECNEHTSTGWIRSRVLKILTDKQIQENFPQFDSFRLLRGERICDDNGTKVYQLFPNLESCVLTVVILRGQLCHNTALLFSTFASRPIAWSVLVSLRSSLIGIFEPRLLEDASQLLGTARFGGWKVCNGAFQLLASAFVHSVECAVSYLLQGCFSASCFNICSQRVICYKDAFQLLVSALVHCSD